MERRDIALLTIYEIEDEIETIPFTELRHLYLENTSEIIYITKNNKLYGIIGLREAVNACRFGMQVKINKSFTVLTNYNIVSAYRIFATKTNIHKIPVINEKGELIGDYSRWDDLLFIERNQRQLMNGMGCSKILGPYDTVYVVKPVKRKHIFCLLLIDCLNNFKVKFTVIDKEQIEGKLSESACFIFVDEEERRGIECLFGIVPCWYNIRMHNIYKYDELEKTNYKFRLTTYKSLMIQIMEENELNDLGIKKPDYVYCDEVDSKAEILLSSLSKKGIKCFCLLLEDMEDKDHLSEYHVELKREIAERLKKYPLSIKEPWPKKNENRAFFDELYQNEDYDKEIAQKEIYVGYNLDNENDVAGKYFNMKNGRRITCFQPQECIGKIYLFGACTILGCFVEDQYTIASFLQKELLKKGYVFQVENYGDMTRAPYAIDAKLAEIEEYSENDIVIYMPYPQSPFVNIQGIAINKIYEKHRIPSTWVTNGYGHHNHKANRVIADDILEMIEPYLSKEKTSKQENFRFDICKEMTGYVRHKYLNQYFSDFDGQAYTAVGSIVMEFDPFDIRHRYLVEQARQQVDFLIIFVMDHGWYPDLFSFEERIKMVIEGTEDIDHVIVVPSGPFVVSGRSVAPFIKGKKNSIAVYSKYDINVFVDYIASLLHITHRFVEKEPENENVRIHNGVMKEILPQKGISYVEIPTMPGGEDLCTSKIQRYLRKEEYDKAFEMLPESTKRYCMGLAGLTED